MFYKKGRGFTLVELLIVIIIIGILAALALPQFSKTKEHAIGKEAIANLRLIAAAEKIYQMEVTDYYPLVGSPKDIITEINSDLKLSLTETNWDYKITGGGSSFTATGDRTTGDYPNCIYSINDTTDDPAPVVPANCP